MIGRNLNNTIRLLWRSCARMAKEKGGKPEAEAPPPPPEPTPQQIFADYIRPKSQTLSSSELEYKQKFEDIPEEQKKMLNGLAEIILELKTPAFMQFHKRGGLGTSECLNATTSTFQDTQINQQLSSFRKS